MILHTVITRGSLVIAEYSNSDDDYSSIIKRRLIDIKKVDGEQKIAKDDKYLYAIVQNDIKFILLVDEEDDNRYFTVLRNIQQEYNKMTAGDQSVSNQQLGQLLMRMSNPQKKSEQIEVQVDEENTELLQKKKPLKDLKYTPGSKDKKSSVRFQKQLCVGMVVVICVSIIKLEESMIQIKRSTEPLQRELNELKSKVGKLDVFITNNPKIDLIQEIVVMLNKQLKIQERLNQVESKQLESSSRYDEIIQKHQIQISQMQPYIVEMKNIIDEARSNREINAAMRQNFNEINQKYKQNLATVLQNDRLTQNFKVMLDQLDSKLATKIDHKEITQLQDMFRRDFVSCVQLDDLKNQYKIRFERQAQEMPNKVEFQKLSDQVNFSLDKQLDSIKDLVEKKIEDIAQGKLRSYASRYDLKLFEERITSVCKIQNERSTLAHMEANQKLTQLNEVLCHQNERQIDFSNQINLINQTFQKVVLKDELQTTIQKTLRLQRESEFLNEKLEQVSTEIFEQKLTMTAFQKQRTVEIQNLQTQLMQTQQDFFKCKGESLQCIGESESPGTQKFDLNVFNNNSISIQAQDQQNTEQNFEQSPQQSPQKSKLRKGVSMLKSRNMSQSQDDAFKRILTRQEERFSNLETQIEEIRYKVPMKKSQFYEDQEYLEKENGLIKELEEQMKGLMSQYNSFNEQIISINVKLQQQNQQNLSQVRDDVLKLIQGKINNIKEYELQLEQKCDQCQIIPILDSKANAKEVFYLQKQQKLIRVALSELLGSLRTYFGSDQNDQIKELLLHQLKRSMNSISEDQELENYIINVEKSKNSNNNSKMPTTRLKSYSAYSQKRKTDFESKTQVIRGKSMLNNKLEPDANYYQSLKNSPLAYKTVNATKRSVTLIKSMKY